MHTRRHVYYWKVDRDDAFRPPHPHTSGESLRQLSNDLEHVLRRRLADPALSLHPGPGEGSHLTFRATSGAVQLFVRVDDGPEQDGYMELEATLHDEVRRLGVPTPNVYLADASRQELPVAYQVMELAPYSDLNRLYKQGTLDLLTVAEQIGRSVASWQAFEPRGFGLFCTDAHRASGALVGLHDDYPTYFNLNLAKHLEFLRLRGFLTEPEVAEIHAVFEDHADILALDQGCLVHKDLALWNVLGTTDEVKAFIDWDDAIVGDPTDDLSLLACFHSADVIEAALRGYASVRRLPDEFAARFWLHLLRNMIVKAVIRVGSGLFQRQDSVFLFSPGGNGKTLEQFTHQRLRHAYESLVEQRPVIAL